MVVSAEISIIVIALAYEVINSLFAILMYSLTIHHSLRCTRINTLVSHILIDCILAIGIHSLRAHSIFCANTIIHDGRCARQFARHCRAFSVDGVVDVLFLRHNYSSASACLMASSTACMPLLYITALVTFLLVTLISVELKL